MKNLQLIFLGLVGVFLSSETNGAVFDEKQLSKDLDKRNIYQASNDFKCPFVFGAFPDPTDCAYFYVCVAGVPVHRKCGFLQHFDILRRRCMPIMVAVCGIDKNKVTTSTSPTAVTETTAGDNFRCTKFSGTFPHPNDCSKYYKCTFFVHSLKTCPEKQLFDTAKSSCKPENEVNCGKRQRPGYTTVAISTEPTVTDISEVISTAEDITEPSTEVSSTTKLRPTGPPDHNCDEDDVDCIITETGDVDDWFICPQAIGSFPHPSSDKLFIFCMNWIPSVKKCGQDLVFSEESNTCIEIAYFVKLLF